jgi:hypothetical protein
MSDVAPDLARFRLHAFHEDWLTPLEVPRDDLSVVLLSEAYVWRTVGQFVGYFAAAEACPVPQLGKSVAGGAAFDAYFRQRCVIDDDVSPREFAGALAEAQE